MKFLAVALAVALVAQQCSSFTIGTKVAKEQKRDKKQIFDATTPTPAGIPTTPNSISIGSVGNVHYSIDAESLKGLDTSKLGDLTLDFSTAGVEDENLKKLGGVRLSSLLNGGGIQGFQQGAGVQQLQQQQQQQQIGQSPIVNIGGANTASINAGEVNLGSRGGFTQQQEQQQQQQNLGNLGSGFNLQGLNLGQYNLPGINLNNLNQNQGFNLGNSGLGLSSYNGFSGLNGFNGLNGFSSGDLSGLNLAGLTFGKSDLSGLQLGANGGLNLASLNVDQSRNYEEDSVVTNSDESADGGSGSDVDKHVYFYGAPEEEELAAPRVILPPTPKKNVKVIFVKAPAFKHAPAPIIAPKSLQHGEEKTVVYVLVKKPEEAQPIVVPTPPPTEPSKPEVVFIKYKNNKDAEEAVSHIQNHGSADGINVGGGVSQVASGNSLQNGQEFLGQLGTNRNLNLDLLTQRAGTFNAPSLSPFSQNHLGVQLGSGLAYSSGGGGGLGVSDNSLGLSGLNSFGIGGGSTTLSPFLSNHGASGLSLGALGLGSATTTASPLGYSTTGHPGTLFDSFGGGDDNSDGRISFKFVKSVPHSEYKPKHSGYSFGTTVNKTKK